MTLTLAVGAGDALADASPRIASVDFTETPVPATDEQRLRTYTSSEALVRYTEGTVKAFPLEYRVLFKNVDQVGESQNAAGQLYDVEGAPLVDPHGDPVIAETPDANSLLDVDGNLYLVTHYEYDWLLRNGQVAKKASGWHSRMPMSMTLTRLQQEPQTGDLAAVAQRPIDFSGVDGLWIPCFGSQTPWNTHLGAEEDYDLYFIPASGEKGHKKMTRGLQALTDVYFKGKREANPYRYGYITEVAVKGDGTTQVTKHYAMGRATWEQALIMPDERTVYFGDDGDHVAMFLFVADRARDLSAGTLYAARWHQVRSAGGGAAALDWVRLGQASAEEIDKLIASGVTFDDIFETTTPQANRDWAGEGFRRIRAGHSGDEYLRLKPDMAKAAAVLEARRYAGYLGATTEFNKMEGVALDPKAKDLYLAMSYIEKGMLAEEGAPVDHIRVDKLKAGGTYRIALAGDRVDSRGDPIDSEWVGTAMHIPAALLGEDIAPDALGNIAHPDKVANPDNVFFSNKMRTLFLGEDSGTHVNNFLWAYNVDTGKLTRILTLASGSEATGLQVVENLNGHAYVMSNNQHQGEWLKTMPEEIKKRLIGLAYRYRGLNDKGALNYRLEANVGYIGGLPGM